MRFTTHYQLFMKSDEPNAVLNGIIGDLKGRILINPKGSKGPLGPLYWNITKILNRLIPTFSGSNTL
jgi:hypothetical protein